MQSSVIGKLTLNTITFICYTVNLSFGVIILYSILSINLNMMMSSIPFRIKIGVTGHRQNLPEENILKVSARKLLGIDEWNRNKTAAVNSVFSLFDGQSIRYLRKAKKTKLAFSVMTALAEGADRIVADTILEMEDAKMEVVLPLTKEDYLTDFKTDESKNDFERLVKKDLFAITLRSKNIDEEYEESKREVARKRAYFNAGNTSLTIAMCS